MRCGVGLGRDSHWSLVIGPLFARAKTWTNSRRFVLPVQLEASRAVRAAKRLNLTDLDDRSSGIESTIDGKFPRLSTSVLLVFACGRWRAAVRADSQQPLWLFRRLLADEAVRPLVATGSQGNVLR
jgi:hypothetical protein